MTADAAASSWRDVAEKGGALGIRVLIAITTVVGRTGAGLVLHVIALWYVLLHGSVRRASREYLERVQGRATLADVYRHVLCFARVTLDRVHLVAGDLRPFEITCHGEEHLRLLAQQKRGAVLILAHLGSFEVMRTLSSARSLRLNILGYFKNAQRINAELRRLNGNVDAQLIEIRPNDPSFIFDVEDRIARGELVGTMGDRVGHDGKLVRVPFLGREAAFPTGPYLLAAALRCPVYLAFGLYHEPNRYELRCEPFAETIDLPRGAREAALASYAARYASRLEHHCRLAPRNWFNFYDYWRAH